MLFKEKEITNTISIKDFYIRRVLRIWPLYFLIIFSAFFIFPFLDFFSVPGFTREIVWNDLFWKLMLFVFFLPNLVLYIFGMIPFAAQTWSIGAEEQFYLVWPVLNKKINGYDELTDLNGDLIVELNDILIAYNNSINFVRVRRP